MMNRRGGTEVFDILLVLSVFNGKPKRLFKFEFTLNYSHLNSRMVTVWYMLKIDHFYLAVIWSIMSELLNLFSCIQIINKVRIKCPQTPLVLYINGNGGLLERMKLTGVDVIGLDWTIDMEDARKRLGNDISIQGNVDPAFLFGPLHALTDEIKRLVM